MMLADLLLDPGDRCPSAVFGDFNRSETGSPSNPASITTSTSPGSMFGHGSGYIFDSVRSRLSRRPACALRGRSSVTAWFVSTHPILNRPVASGDGQRQVPANQSTTRFNDERQNSRHLQFFPPALSPLRGAGAGGYRGSALGIFQLAERASELCRPTVRGVPPGLDP
jgi:hypothetical protein